MEIKSGELFRREIFGLADGKCLGFADGLLLEMDGTPACPGRAAVRGLVIRGKRRLFGLLGREPDRVILWEMVAVIGEDAIFIREDGRDAG